MLSIFYQKNENAKLFETLEVNGITKPQNYIPLYRKFFSFSPHNYNKCNSNNSLIKHLEKDKCPYCSDKEIDLTIEIIKIVEKAKKMNEKKKEWISINCENKKCENCLFSWRNAQLNPDCFLREFVDFIEDIERKND